MSLRVCGKKTDSVSRLGWSDFGICRVWSEAIDNITGVSGSRPVQEEGGSFPELLNSLRRFVPGNRLHNACVHQRSSVLVLGGKPGGITCLARVALQPITIGLVFSRTFPMLPLANCLADALFEVVQKLEMQQSTEACAGITIEWIWEMNIGVSGVLIPLGQSEFAQPRTAFSDGRHHPGSRTAEKYASIGPILELIRVPGL